MAGDATAGPKAYSAPTISIIVPAYNAEKFITETLQSILSQEYKDLEIIVIDDGSTDCTKDLVMAYPTVRYYFQHNQGPAIARNAGLQLSRGAYVTFMDADDMWHPSMLRSCLDILEARPEIGAVHAKWVIVDENGRVTDENTGWKPWRGKVFERLLVEIAFVTPSVVWRRKLWEEIGGFDLTPEINDDWYNWLQIAHRGTMFDFIEEPLVYVRKHTGSLGQRQSTRIIQWRLNALDQICKQFQVTGELQIQAYGQTYWRATVESIMHGKDDEAVDNFLQAVTRMPEILVQRSTYFELAHAYSEVTVQDSPDLVHFERDIQLLLDRLFGVTGLPEGVLLLKHRAESMAYFTLSQIVYGLGYHWQTAVSFLLRSLQTDPSIIWNAERVIWAVRIVLGRAFIGQVRRVAKPWMQRPDLPNKHTRS